MKFKIQVKNKGSSNSTAWWEEYDKSAVNSPAEAEVWGRETIETFNDNLWPGEKARDFLKSEIIAQGTREHDWEKQNLITQTDSERSWDVMECNHCGITGRRYMDPLRRLYIMGAMFIMMQVGIDYLLIKELGHVRELPLSSRQEEAKAFTATQLAPFEAQAKERELQQKQAELQAEYLKLHPELRPLPNSDATAPASAPAPVPRGKRDK